MKSAKVQSLRALREEMKAVARGERRAPADAGKPSFNSVEAVVRLLTPDNRRLLALIRDRKPRSVAELVAMTGRAQPNLTRTLAKLEAAGFIISTRATGSSSESRASKRPRSGRTASPTRSPCTRRTARGWSDSTMRTTSRSEALGSSAATRPAITGMARRRTEADRMCSMTPRP